MKNLFVALFFLSCPLRMSASPSGPLLEHDDGNAEGDLILESGIYITRDLCSVVVAQRDDLLILQHGSDCAASAIDDFQEISPGQFASNISATDRVLVEIFSTTSFLASRQSLEANLGWRTARQFLFTKFE